MKLFNISPRCICKAVTLKNIFLSPDYRDFSKSLGAATQYDAYGRTIVEEFVRLSFPRVISPVFYILSSISTLFTLVTPTEIEEKRKDRKVNSN